MERVRFKEPNAKPTVRQVYTLARELCERAGERFPGTRADASALIDRLRADSGRPAAA